MSVKVGDRVKVIRDKFDGEDSALIGKCGTVIDVDGSPDITVDLCLDAVFSDYPIFSDFAVFIEDELDVIE